jgi:cytochrome b561
MITQYLTLAIVLAFMLNHHNCLVRATGTLTAAIALSFMVASIVLADLDGTFAAIPDTASLFDRAKPIVLNVQAVVGGLGVGFLLWATWRQTKRIAVSEVPLRNTASGFGLVSRYAHWATATLILALIPMGLFMSVLPEASPDRAMFVEVHQTVGLVVIILVAVRLAWLVASRPPALPTSLAPWERRLAVPTHIGLYALILTMPITGLLLTTTSGAELSFLGWDIPLLAEPQTAPLWGQLHNWILPTLFGLAFLAHLGAVLKHHFLGGRKAEVRRMLR